MKHTITVELTDMATGKPSGKKMIVDVSDQGVFIGVEGYGEKTSTPEAARPVMLEFYEGSPRVYVWSDINKEEPVHSISLRGAQEVLRND